jgi:hypothetical protein
MKTKSLASIARINSGSAVLRGGGDSLAVMVGDLDGSGQLPRTLTKVRAPASGAASALSLGDIVISLRGNSNNAAVVDLEDVAGTPLFATLDLAVVRLNDPESVIPHYIATWLNLPSTQAKLAENREGTAAKRLPLSPLKALEIPLPTWERQAAIVSLARDVAEERRIGHRLLQLRTTLFNACLAEAAVKETAL